MTKKKTHDCKALLRVCVFIATEKLVDQSKRPFNLKNSNLSGEAFNGTITTFIPFLEFSYLLQCLSADKHTDQSIPILVPPHH
jgi:hypothetical protein